MAVALCTYCSSTLWICLRFVPPRTKATQGQDVPAKQRGPKQRMGPALFLAGPGTLCASVPVPYLVPRAVKFPPGEGDGMACDTAQHVRGGFCLQLQIRSQSHAHVVTLKARNSSLAASTVTFVKKKPPVLPLLTSSVSLQVFVRSWSDSRRQIFWRHGRLAGTGTELPPTPGQHQLHHPRMRAGFLAFVRPFSVRGWTSWTKQPVGAALLRKARPEPQGSLPAAVTWLVPSAHPRGFPPMVDPT